VQSFAKAAKKKHKNGEKGKDLGQKSNDLSAGAAERAEGKGGHSQECGIKNIIKKKGKKWPYTAAGSVNDTGESGTVSPPPESARRKTKNWGGRPRR